ncbi:MlaD family protein [Proteiniphilum sp. X52]|uniref:MlaD family protein n=1 Tax=Proteiniphilum sp. X52 TaxID=2382159 RepID=UPI000F09FEE1|nr:MlaD family protein [Proteiniphilum sp. X52]RNC65675.1 MCE family protein [Proteiniphilum sp. X52]
MKNTKKALRLGIFVAAALILFVVAVYLIGSKGNLFSPTKDVFSSFKDIRGLVEGNNVRFAGINVGTVKNIRIISDTSVVVTMSIREDYSKYIYKNSKVQIGQEGLMGGKIVLISSGTPEAGVIEDNDFLAVAEGLDVQGMIAQAQTMLREATQTVSNLNSVTDKINEGDGDIARLLNGNDLTTQLGIAARKLNSSMSDVNEITRKVSNGQGDLGKLISDDAITDQLSGIMENLYATSVKADGVVGELQQTAHAINYGEGVLPRLLHDKELGLSVDTALTRVDKGVFEVTRAAETIADSWIFRLFSKKKKDVNKPPQSVPVKRQSKEFEVHPGDTIIVPMTESADPEIKRSEN